MMSERSCFTEYCENIEDYRQEGKVRHPLREIIFIAVAGTIANADSWPQVETFAETHEEWLRKFLELPYGIPSHDTYERVFDRIDPIQFSKAFTEWTNDIADRSGQAIVAVDGKTVRGSFDNQKDKSAIHIVNAWISSNSIILGQLKTSDKSNEITAIPELLDMLFLKGCIITIDAMGCQKSIAEKIVEKKADYVIALKGNQPTLHENVVEWFDDAKSSHFKGFELDQCRTIDKGHGRIEKRTYYITDDIDWLYCKDDWEGLKSIGMAVRECSVNDQVTIEKRYFICSIKADAKLFAKAVRSHWGIESTHWLLDVVLKEDASRERKNNGPENKSLLNKS
jgi:predicted transposase YbfD/YdcC